MRKTQCGQAMVEFAMSSIVFLGLVFGIIDLARAGFMQHNLNNGASDLASSLAQLSGTNGSGDLNTYSATALDLSNPTTAAQMQDDFAHAAQVANYNFKATSPLTTTTGAGATTTLTNGQVTVVAWPSLANTTELTVTVTAPFTPVVGFYLNHAVLHLQARASVLTPAGQLAP